LKFYEVPSVGSTNLEVKSRLDAGEATPFWIRADRQTAGRGRRGRVWTSEVGAASLAVADTLADYPLTHAPELKWPNDVLLGGAKVSGILLERHKRHIVIGIGINLVSHPEVPERVTTHLLEHIQPDALLSPEPPFAGAAGVLPSLARHLDHWVGTYRKAGFGPMREAWMSRSKGLPGPVTVRLPHDTFSGTALDLQPDGALRVQRTDGTIVDVHAGDVFFGPPTATQV